MVGVLVGTEGKVGVATVRQLSMNVVTKAKMKKGANHVKRFIEKPPGFITIYPLWTKFYW